MFCLDFSFFRSTFPHVLCTARMYSYTVHVCDSAQYRLQYTVHAVCIKFANTREPCGLGCANPYGFDLHGHRMPMQHASCICMPMMPWPRPACFVYTSCRLRRPSKCPRSSYFRRRRIVVLLARVQPGVEAADRPFSSLEPATAIRACRPP